MRTTDCHHTPGGGLSLTSQNTNNRMSASQAELYRLALGASKILKAMGRSQQRLAGPPPPIATTVVARSPLATVPGFAVEASCAQSTGNPLSVK